MSFRVLEEAVASSDDRARFFTGDLVREWSDRYPQIFDPQETQIALNQLEGHFPEWFGAVHLFETEGWLSLVESYQFKNHEWKRSVLRSLGAENLIDFFDSQRSKGFGKQQAPDLLVYAPDLSDYYFCEVKGPTDKLSPRQPDYFAAVSQASGGKEVVLLPVSFS